MALLGWIDFSSKHRSRVAALLDALKAEGILDELGISTIRDALADQMFPGINTIQTRAKYFFIIPYILFEYQKLLASGKTTKSPDKYLEDKENEIMWELGDKYEHNPRSNSGVIGITKIQPQKIIRRASEIYWNGLNEFSIITHGGEGRDTFLRRKSQKDFFLRTSSYAGDDAGRDDKDAEYENIFQIKIEYDPTWRENLRKNGLTLTKNEAHTLKHRFIDRGQNLLLGELVENTKAKAAFLVERDFATAAKNGIRYCSPRVQTVVRIAHDFSEVMYGAHIAYNYFLQKAKNNSEDYAKDLHTWHRTLRQTLLDYAHYNPEEVLQYAPRAERPLGNFIKLWWQEVSQPQLNLSSIQKLITQRELNVKRYKARLYHQKFSDVSKDWIGLKRLNYRLPQVKRMLHDIEEGLKSQHA